MQHAGSMTLKTIAPLSEDPIVELPPWRAGTALESARRTCAFPLAMEGLAMSQATARCLEEVRCPRVGADHSHQGSGTPRDETAPPA
jgi:hypothetical protein